MAKFGLLQLPGETFTGEVREFGTDTPDDISHKFLEWRSFRQDPDPAFDPTTQRLESTTFLVQPTEIVGSRGVVALTQLELDGIDKNKIQGALLDIGFIITKIVNILVNKNIVAGVPLVDPAVDIDAETRQEYQNLKTLVDRLRP